MEKVTKREHFAMLTDLVNKSDVVNKEDLLKFIAHEVELLDKKHSTKKETETQKQNKILAETVYGIVADANGRVSIAEVMEQLEEMGTPVSNQKASYILNSLAKELRIVKTYEKKVPYYSL